MRTCKKTLPLPAEYFLRVAEIGLADFSYIFSGENFWEIAAENFPPKNVGKKWNFPRKKF
jgi:hypothetical protein